MGPLEDLNSFIRCKDTSKDLTLNNSGSSISNPLPSVIAEVFNIQYSSFKYFYIVFPRIIRLK